MQEDRKIHAKRGRIRIGFAGATVLAATAAVIVSISPSSGADPVTPSRFKPAPAGSTVNHLPLGLTNTPVTVMLQMAGDPVTVVDANATTPMSNTQRASRRAQLKSMQNTAATRVRALGGKVLGQYQSAYNGIKVRIAANKVDSLRSIPNVTAIRTIQLMTPDNVHGVPLIGAPAVWDGLNGLHGEGIKVAVIDTGIDWTHADFGGAGTPQAYLDAHANETAPADPAYFGPNAPKVKGGTDLVGDDYNADPTSATFQPIPHPDPNPLDCNGHGSHVAGTAVGFGVLSNGTTYNGPYNDSTVSGHQWLVGPGVAPKADLYSVRVFGCAGSTDVTVDAIEWAVNNHMDVINMSLGSPFGDANDPSAVAATNAAKDGVIVVASAGNNGQNPYITGSPATGTNVISVAANDPTSGFPGATASLSTGTTSTAINANGIPFSDGLTLPVKVLHTGTAISLGCDPNEYNVPGVAGALVVVARGTCARIARAIFGQKAGAAAVLMVNNANSLPPFEGPITSNPDTGEHFTVTIPFLGVASGDAAKWNAADGGTVTLHPQDIANPGFLAPASFTSGGPRTGDSWLKPDVTAPGVSIASAGVGTGNTFAVISGTSMAAPHTAGMAALVRQAHPAWNKVNFWKAAIVNTADPSQVAGYTTRVAGTGLIQAPAATLTNVVAQGDSGTATLNYGYAEIGQDYTKVKAVKLHNFGTSAVTFNVSTDRDAGSPHSVTLGLSSVTVPARSDATVNVTLSVPATTAGDSSAFHDVSGLVTFTPTGGGNRGISLRVPYYLVPQATSAVTVTLGNGLGGKNATATATVTNPNAATTGTADWYAWGLTDGTDAGLGSNDVRNIGVQAFPGVVAFGISTAHRWSNAAMDEFDIDVDVNNDGTDDYDVVGADLGALTTGTSNGQMATAVFDLRTGAGSIQFLADAPTDSTTIVLPVLVSQLCASGSPCLSSGNPRFTYHAVAFNLTDNSVDTVNGSAKFNAFTPSISTGMFDVVAPNGTATETITVNKPEWVLTPARGLMIISHDNASTKETRTFNVTVKP